MESDRRPPMQVALGRRSFDRRLRPGECNQAERPGRKAMGPRLSRPPRRPGCRGKVTTFLLGDSASGSRRVDPVGLNLALLSDLQARSERPQGLAADGSLPFGGVHVGTGHDKWTEPDGNREQVT